MELVIINSVTCLVINIFHYKKNEPWDIARKWHSTQWQADVLMPLKNSMTSKYIKEISSSLYQIIEVCGEYIVREGWNVILSILQRAIELLNDNSLAANEVYSYAEDILKCIEDICDKSLHKIDVSNIEDLLEILCHFIYMKNSVEMGLSSVDSILKVVLFISQQQSTGKLLNAPEKSSKLWTSIFAKLTEAGKSEHIEIRNGIYKTLSAIIETCCDKLPLSTWSNSLLTSISDLLKFATANYFDYSQGMIAMRSNMTCTPKFVVTEEKKPKAMKFDPEIIARNAEEQKVKRKLQEKSITILYNTLMNMLLKLHSLK